MWTGLGGEVLSADWIPWPVIRRLHPRYPYRDLALAAGAKKREGPSTVGTSAPTTQAALVWDRSRGAMDAVAGSCGQALRSIMCRHESRNANRVSKKCWHDSLLGLMLACTIEQKMCL